VGDVRNDHGSKPNPRIQTLHEAVAFGQGLKRIGHTPVHKPKVACIHGYVHHGVAIDKRIKQGRAQPLDHGFVGTRIARRTHHVGTLNPGFKHLRHQVGGVLQVGIHQQNNVAHRAVNSGCQGGFFAEVARKSHVTHTGAQKPGHHCR